MEKKKDDVMIDIETLGTRPTSAIVQIGACYFDRETGEIGETFSRCIRPNNDDYTVDYDTIDWWIHQSEKARNSVFDKENSVSINWAIYDLSIFLTEALFIWSHATFDIPILINAFKKTGYDFPVHHKGMRDIRTLIDLANQKKLKTRKGIHHNALDDCKYQVEYCVQAMNRIKTVDK